MGSRFLTGHLIHMGDAHENPTVKSLCSEPVFHFVDVFRSYFREQGKRRDDRCAFDFADKLLFRKATHCPIFFQVEKHDLLELYRSGCGVLPGLHNIRIRAADA